ncbi:acyltransferase family protein [Pseudohalocynthiibacter sp. F2068]|jgi:peptidoglycan/LPS O-acetylase OafA/YrhL|uniref:acyltransferase family protein n=1 Tax=Pseudohalocynthiibacter sp. F2068 TaxID=2926418 RepID=UPI001FF1A374|nr:acyltransferase family protein [Pseudohalocynthiibacter sp. F2068]MCK0103894.1 acyltransferase [Pseudohalocynthiibacter sp. F2068]
MQRSKNQRQMPNSKYQRSITYSPEIDGLRAIAVISVIIYHLKIGSTGSYFLPGGFLGVDLFFVISGYLITKILLAELDASGRISITKFYWRRARRILPALLFVIIIFIPIAWIILLPSEIEIFAHSLLASLLFYANIFWLETQSAYGAQSALLQPFLHIWSLAVEEQFYIVFPLFLAFLHRRSWVGFAIPVLIVLGLIFAYTTTLWKPNLSFYSPTSRAWEMLVGSLMGWLSLRSNRFGKSLTDKRLLPTVGIIIILWSIVTFRFSEIVHPGLATAPLILGVFLVIWFAEPREPVTRLLSTRPFVWIGLRSYALYLWHFPIFAFGRHLNALPEPLEKATWIALTFAMATFSYRFVEEPFRRRVTKLTFAGFGSAIAACVIGFTITVSINQGFPNRFPQLQALYGKNEFDNEVLRDLSWSILDNLAGEEKIETWNAHAPSQNEQNNLWYPDTDQIKILIVGNSHSKDLFNALYLNSDHFPDQAFAHFGMESSFPAKQRELLYDAPNFQAADIVLISSKYYEATVENLPGFITQLRDLGKRVVLAGNTAEFSLIGNMPIFDWYIRREGKNVSLSDLGTIAHQHENVETHKQSELVKDIAEEMDIQFLDRRMLVCNDADGVCDLITKGGWKALYDYGHWTIDGARYFGQRASELDWLSPVLSEVPQLRGQLSTN